jgi:hypothetical protein
MFNVSRSGRILCLVAGLAALAAWDRPVLSPYPHGPKPLFPVLTQLQLANSPTPGSVATVLATITAWAPGEPVEWKLDLPAGLTLLDGPRSWSGSLGRGESLSFELSVLIPDGASYEIGATARLPEQPRATSGATLPIDLGGYDGPRASEKLVVSDGATYIQYQGEMTPPKEAGR